MKNNLITILSGLLILFGLLTGYVLLFGDNLFYTKTYNVIYKIGKPTLDYEFIIMALAICLQLFIFIFSPQYGKFDLIDKIERNSKLQRFLQIFSIIVLLTIIITFIISLNNKNWAIFNSGLLFGILSLSGSFAFYFLYYSIFPKVTNLGLKLATPIGRIISIPLFLIIVVLTISAFEILFNGGNEKQKFDSKLSNTEFAKNPTHDISIIVEDPPTNIKPGETKTIDVRFRMKKYDDRNLSGYPVSLDSNVLYSAVVSLKSVGFESISLTDNEKPQKIELDKQLIWKWLITPKDKKDGSTQQMFISLNLQNQKDSLSIHNLPLTLISINIETPFGLPKWLVSPDVTVAAMLLGFFGLIFPIFQDYFKEKLKTLEKE